MAVKNWIAAAFAVACMLLASAQLASAQSPKCIPREKAEKQLAEKYGETRRAGGLARGTIVEMWANDETGTWTVTITRPDGMTCLAADGQAYREYEPTPAGDPA